MFGFAKKIKEYVKLGNAMDALYIQLSILEKEITDSDNPSFYYEHILALTFVLRKEILNRMDDYNWNMEGKILINSIYPSNISLQEAYSVIMIKLRNISSLFDANIQEGIEDILEKGETYYELKKHQNRQ